jgi:hypothetical protein
LKATTPFPLLHSPENGLYFVKADTINHWEKTVYAVSIVDLAAENLAPQTTPSTSLQSYQFTITLSAACFVAVNTTILVN